MSGPPGTPAVNRGKRLDAVGASAQQRTTKSIFCVGPSGIRRAMRDQSSQETERRPVRSDDPSLSQTANELLTHELREAVGADEVLVPKDVPKRAGDRHATRSPYVATLTANRPLLIVSFLVALVLGGIVALVTGQYWAVVVAAGLHAVGTLAVAAGAIALTTRPSMSTRRSRRVWRRRASQIPIAC